jgi:MraZ protein
MFDGEERMSLDDKHRVPIPKRFRALLGEPVRVVLARDFLNLAVPHLNVWPIAVWESYTAPVREEADWDVEVDDYSRLLHGSSRRLEADKAGRIAIPPELREWAALRGEVVWVGNGRKLEVWDPERLESDRQRLLANAPAAIAKLRQLRRGGS